MPSTLRRHAFVPVLALLTAAACGGPHDAASAPPPAPACTGSACAPAPAAPPAPAAATTLVAAEPPAVAAPEAPPAVAPSPRDYARALAEARKHVAAKDFDAAAQAYDRALGFAPEDAVAMSGRGYAKMLGGQRDGAAADFATAMTWAKTEREKKMIAANQALLARDHGPRGPSCSVTVTRERVHATTYRDVPHALAGVLGEFDFLTPDERAAVCKGSSCDAPTVQDLGSSETGSAAFVAQKRPDGSVTVAPFQMSDPGGRCSGGLMAAIVSDDPLIVEASEESMEEVDPDDATDDVPDGCWLTGVTAHTYVLDRATLDVVLEVRRRATCAAGQSNEGMAGSAAYADGVITVKGCGATQRIPVKAP